jgi:hypothetical protein
MSKTTDKNDKPELQRFVFGLDESKKPVGARFPTSETKVLQVAQARKLECHTYYNNQEWAALCMQLPVGRIYARGKAFIPFIKPDLYEKLQTALARCKEDHARSQNERTAAAALKAGADKTAPPSVASGPTVASGLPRTWQEIAPGHLVLAQESLPDGWWEAIVVSRDDNILTLQYRDYPKAPKFTRHAATIALLNPNAS